MTATLQEPATGGDVSQAVALAPADSARNVIQATATDVIALIVKAVVEQTASLVVLKDEDGVDVLTLGAHGEVNVLIEGTPALAIQRPNQGFQVRVAAVQGGDVALVVGGAPGQLEDIQQWQDEFGFGAVKIGSDASLLLASPNGSWHRLLVADDGTVSTEPA